jgi:hypothetical protein
MREPFLTHNVGNDDKRGQFYAYDSGADDCDYWTAVERLREHPNGAGSGRASSSGTHRKLRIGLLSDNPVTA